MASRYVLLRAKQLLSETFLDLVFEILAGSFKMGHPVY